MGSFYPGLKPYQLWQQPLATRVQRTLRIKAPDADEGVLCEAFLRLF